MTPRRLIAALTLTLTAAILAACGAEGVARTAAPSSSRRRRRWETSPAQVAGERADVRQILRPSSDPHAYEPRPSDVKAIAAASVVLRSGGDLDEWLGGVLATRARTRATVTLIDAVRTPRRRRIDPHWWQDPRNAIAAVAGIRDALVAADPAGREVYAANAAAYLARAARARRGDRVRAWRRSPRPSASSSPTTTRSATTPTATASRSSARSSPRSRRRPRRPPARSSRLVRTIRPRASRRSSPRARSTPSSTRAIAREAGATVGRPLYADALGAAGSDGATYIGSLRANTRALESGFTNARTRCAL